MKLNLLLSSAFLFTGITGSLENRTDDQKIQSIVSVYPALPGNEFRSDRYEVAVVANGKSQNSYVYMDPDTYTEFPVSRTYMSDENHFTSFSFSGNIDVRVKLPGRTKLSSVTIRPLSKKISASITGNTISIKLSSPANIYVEVEGEEKHPLFIFANPPEINVPSLSDTNVIYFPPGIHHIGDKGSAYQSIPVGKTVYVAGGAYVKGVLKTTDEVGVTTIRGRGIISGVDIPATKGYKGQIHSLHGGFNMEGIISISCPYLYQAAAAFGSNSVIDNVKFLQWHIGSGSLHVGPKSIVKNCFFKINDDVMMPIYSDMKFLDNTVWTQSCGPVVELGWNSEADITNSIVSGVDVIAYDMSPWTNPDIENTPQGIALRNSKGAKYSGIVIENIRFEVTPHVLFLLQIKDDYPGYTEGLGSVDGIVFRNLTVPGTPRLKSLFDGNGTETGEIRNIVFENVNIGGTRLTQQNADSMILMKGKTSNFFYK